jgi:MOSC domain-containing protein YiiM
MEDTEMTINLVTLSVGVPNNYLWNGENESSAIGKQRIDKVYLTMNGFKGDKVANLEFHGGPDRAVCLYPYEHYELWKNEFGKDFSPPAFGENICVSGMMEENVYIGDIYKFGEATIQISQGRVPCSKISKFNGESKLLNRIIDTCKTGYFFRVLEEGEVSVESSITLLERPQNTQSIKQANHVFFHDRNNKAAIYAILEVKELADVWRQQLMKMLETKF